MARAYPPPLRLLAALSFGSLVIAFSCIKDAHIRESVIISAAVSYLGYLATKWAIPVLKPVHLRRNLFGYDINKKGMPFFSFQPFARMSDSGCSFC
jgi:hypothetical protein